ncbi:membrane protein [Longispora fulva]|uniref:DUF4267 domain-containing protein n=1 Tax=Longispora fulva TaxID=619741 RepID=A0A8J7G8B2_9ACTN|nr:DUF4267 domain-containing protein [Longispora fulva]MBG6135558.1 hypothetical protein [Longispora fulva]GIG56203.1 membrane protein [Longispora fulva]
MKPLATGLAVLGGLFIVYVGLGFLLDPQGSAAGFGLPTWPRHDGAAFLAVKGVRDIACGLTIFALLLTGHRRALGWALLAVTFVPAGDMVIVLSSGGSRAAAFAIHGLTAVLVLLNAVLLLRERPSAATTPPPVAAAAE